VATPIERTITNYEEYTGRMAAVKTVEIRARVSGYLDHIHFEDGADLEENAPLFQIDDRPFVAAVDQAQSHVSQLEARLERLKKTEDRALRLIEQKVTTTEDYEVAKYQALETESEISAAKATLDIAKLNLEFTKINSPIAGRISRRLVDAGNLVQADVTPLATVVTLDPLYAYFDADERTVLQVRRLIAEGKITSARDQAIQVQVALADDKQFSLTGTIDFVDNQVTATTGTLRIRAVIDNPKKLLAPGMFVRVRVPIGLPRQALLVHEESLASDQGERFVYVVTPEDKVEDRRVVPGKLDGKFRVIESGLSPGERVVVTGLQRVKPGIKVVTKQYEDSRPGTITNVHTPDEVLVGKPDLKAITTP
jgi:RND family efflux transporter MFP subunit